MPSVVLSYEFGLQILRNKLSGAAALLVGAVYSTKRRWTLEYGSRFERMAVVALTSMPLAKPCRCRTEVSHSGLTSCGVVITVVRLYGGLSLIFNEREEL